VTKLKIFSKEPFPLNHNKLAHLAPNALLTFVNEIGPFPLEYLYTFHLAH